MEDLWCRWGFTLLTECYSPTCTRDRLCYSIACPRRLEQQARLNLKPQPGLRREESQSSLHADEWRTETLDQHCVKGSRWQRWRSGKETAGGYLEIMYTERDFVKDLEYLRDFWMKPLRSINPASPSPVPEHRREKFIRTVFSNCMEVHAVNWGWQKPWPDGSRRIRSSRTSEISSWASCQGSIPSSNTVQISCTGNLNLRETVEPGIF
jgi:hypothetical protein